jgi:hypothetical protein
VKVLLAKANGLKFMREESIQTCTRVVLPLYFHYQQLLFDKCKTNDCKHFITYIYFVIIYMKIFVLGIYGMLISDRKCNINMVLHFLFEPLG